MARAIQTTKHPCARPLCTSMGDFTIVLEAAWLVRDVDDIDDAIGVAISEAGRRLNEASMQYVDVDVGVTGCPVCDAPFDSAFIAADTALVGLALEMEVFNAEGDEHATRIAKKEIGGALRNVPLNVVEVIDRDATDDDTHNT